MKRYFYCSLIAITSALALFLNISLFKVINMDNLSCFYNINVVFISLVTILLFIFHMYKGSFKLSKMNGFLAILFALFMVIGESYVEANSLGIVFKNFATIIMSIVKVIGYTFLFRIMLYYLDKLLTKFKNKDLKVKNKKLKWYIAKLERHPFLTPFLTIIACWSIYLIAFYPIVLSPDPSFQIMQYFNIPTKYIDWVIQIDPNVFMTAHHPVTQTFLIGWCIEFGRFIINDNFGLFLYTLIQTLIYSMVLAYTIYFARRNNASTKCMLILTCLYIFVPMYPFYSVSAVKDTLYTAFMILFCLFVYDYIKNYHLKKISIKYLCYITIVMILLSLFRHNGLYVIMLTCPFLLFSSKKNILRILIAILIFLGSIYSFNNILVPSLGVSPGSKREMLSIPFQQTARYIKYHEDELSKKDKVAIDKVLGYDTIVDRYDPEKSDPVKNEYNKYTTDSELKEYFKVWAECLVKHPETYIDATLHNTYGYIYPNSHKWYLYSEYDTRIVKNNLVDYHFNGLGWLRDFLKGYGNIFPYIPVIGLLSSIGANTWALLILAGYLISKKHYRYLITLIPLFTSLLICFVSPVNTYFRYTMPYIFVLPILITLFLVDGKWKNEKK